jgi:hypothetical protein
MILFIIAAAAAATAAAAVVVDIAVACVFSLVSDHAAAYP